MAFDVQSMTLQEIEEVERRAKLSIRALDDESKPQGTLYRALALVALRRQDPGASWEDTATLSMRDMTALVKGEDPDPLEQG